MLVVVIATLAVAAIGCKSDDGPNNRDAGSPDAALHDAQIVDAQGPPPSDAGTTHDAAVSDSGAGLLDAAADIDAAEIDAAVRRDAATEVDAATPHDSGPAVDEEDAGSPDAGPPPFEDTFSMRVVATGLDAPWEITWGPDDRLWISERAGFRIVRMDPVSGSLSVALSLPDVFQESGQDGVLGMALHPQLGKSLGNDYVYLAYTYDADASGAVDRRAKIVRFTYDATLGTLDSPVALIEGLPASSDHNSGRLKYGPDDRLYYTIGDQGHNQFDNRCLTIRAQDLPSQGQIDSQDWSTYQGKILRLQLDGAIPSDNPTLAGARSHIFSYGHRNAQGIAFGPDGKLYASEQGPKTDDEINLIVAGKNYGWPRVAGYRDDNAYVYGDWSASSPEPCESLEYSDYYLPESIAPQQESAWSHVDYVPPLRTFYTVDNDYNFVDPACESSYICWPTIAPSSLDLYVPGSSGLQTWGTALLVPSLKRGSVFYVKLSADGEASPADAKELFKTTNRYRDLTIARDKRTFYVITDSYGDTSGPTSGSTQLLEHRGAVLEFTYTSQP